MWTTLRRPLLRSFFLAAAALAWAAAASAQTLLSPAALEVTTPPRWTDLVTLRQSVGWRDNILLSPFAPVGRSFERSEIDALASKKWRSFDLLAFLSGDVLRYFSPPPEIAGEQFWAAELEGKWKPLGWFQLSLKGVGYLQDTVLDLSDTSATRVVVPARVRGGYLMPTARFALPAGFAWEASAQGKRAEYLDFPGDFQERKIGAALSWTSGPHLTLTASGFEHRRDYAESPQYTAGGRALAGTRLQFRQKEWETNASTAWTAGGAWTVALAGGGLENRDGTSGFFDYNQKRVKLTAAWERNAWRATLEGEAKRADYLVQTVGAGIAPPSRVADTFEVVPRLERELSLRWTIFTECRWERNRSNDPEYNYRATTLLGGLQFML